MKKWTKDFSQDRNHKQTNKQKTFDVIKNKGIKVKNSMRQHL